MIEISTIIPTYNRAERLSEALQSVLVQGGVSQEVLVIDDGSTDETAELIHRQFPGVLYKHTENSGPARARNIGVQAARGEWIAFLDSDDLWLPGKLKAQLDFFSAHPDYEICQTEELWIRNGVRVNPMKKHKKHHGLIYKQCLALCIISPSAVMMKKSLFEKVGGFNESFPVCEDYDLWLRISAEHPVGLIEQPYVTKFGGHIDQLSHAYPAMDRYRIESLLGMLQSGILTSEQKKWTRAALKEKSNIFIQGARKRGRSEEAQKVEKLIHAVL